MKTKINTAELESHLSDYRYHRRGYERATMQMNVATFDVMQQLQTEVKEGRLTFPEGTSQIKFGCAFYANVTFQKGLVVNLEPILTVDLYDLQEDVPEEDGRPIFTPDIYDV